MGDAVAYIRVSTDEQATSGLGLDAQRQAIQGVADRAGLTIASWYADEGLSGAAPPERRPGLMGAINAVRGDDVLLVAKRDRLARDVMLGAWIDKEVTRRGGRIESAAGEGNGDDPASQLMRRIIDAFAEYERGMIRARTKAAMRAKRARGEWCGGIPPYGYRHEGGLLIEHEPEQDAVRLATSLRRDGMSLSRIAESLDLAGYRPRTGRAWHKSTVRNIVNGHKRTDAE